MALRRRPWGRRGCVLARPFGRGHCCRGSVGVPGFPGAGGGSVDLDGLPLDSRLDKPPPAQSAGDGDVAALRARIEQLEAERSSFVEAEVDYLRQLAVVNQLADSLGQRRSFHGVLADAAGQAARITGSDRLWLVVPGADGAAVDAHTPAGAVVPDKLPAEAVDLFHRIVNDETAMPLTVSDYTPSTREGLYLALPARSAKHTVAVLVVYYPQPGAQALDEHGRILQTMLEQTAVACENVRLFAALGSMIVDAVVAMAVAIESRDPYTGGHVHRVTAYSLMLGEAIGLDRRSLTILRLGGLLHDIGKVAVPDAVLRKPGALTVEETRLMQSHVTVGHNIIRSVPQLASTCDIIRHHHEWFDGRGYPDGLAGTDIPLLARIVAVADAFDAMNSNRPYRRGMTEQIAMGEIVKGAGTQFDPDLVKPFASFGPDRFGAAVADLQRWYMLERQSEDLTLIDLLQLDLPTVPGLEGQGDARRGTAAERAA